MTTEPSTDVLICNRCDQAKPVAEFPKRKDSRTGYAALCHECNRERVKAWREGRNDRQEDDRARRLRWKLEALAHYGGRCTCCGETQHQFLTFDHVYGGGRQHRKTEAYTDMLRWLRANKFPPEYQVLCWNCNAARHFNGGQCPHQDR